MHVIFKLLAVFVRSYTIFREIDGKFDQIFCNFAKLNKKFVKSHHFCRLLVKTKNKQKFSWNWVITSKIALVALQKISTMENQKKSEQSEVTSNDRNNDRQENAVRAFLEKVHNANTDADLQNLIETEEELKIAYDLLEKIDAAIFHYISRNESLTESESSETDVEEWIWIFE